MSYYSRFSAAVSTKGLCILFSIFIFTSCATYYQKSINFQESFVQGDLSEANKILDSNKKAAEDKNRLLFFLQKGVVTQMLGEYDRSNEYFEDAYLYSEDFRKSYSAELASLISNPNVKPYKGEDHELVLLHYYKAMNYLHQEKFDEALVECRRLDNKLNLLNDRYPKRKNRYRRDAFVLNLMGLIYDASGDDNNAFIAFRNAYNTYKEDYQSNFQVAAPLQLKKDLLRSAKSNGFYEELELFEKEFGMKSEPVANTGGELLFFWQNGLGPVKDEFSINFFIVKGQGGVVMFVNEELGLSFPFPLPAKEDGASGGLGDLKFVRVAFPKYLERKSYFRSAELNVRGKKFQLEEGENINEIAKKTLEDRMMRELGNSLMRLALKQAAEQQVRAQNQNVGALLSAFNAVSEKADTRNWQTLPFSISYARVPLDIGENNITLEAFSPQKSNKKSTTFTFTGASGKTLFFNHHSIESLPIDGAYRSSNY